MSKLEKTIRITLFVIVLTIFTSLCFYIRWQYENWRIDKRIKQRENSIEFILDENKLLKIP